MTKGTEVLPIPTRIKEEEGGAELSTPEQRRVEKILLEMADALASPLGLSRRSFLASASGMAAAFLAMNAVHGPLFSVNAAEAADPSAAAERLKKLSEQFIFDVQTHFINDRYNHKWILALREDAKKWNPELKGEKITLDKLRFGNYIKEVFLQSDTSLALLSSAPSDDPNEWFLHNPEIVGAREEVNSFAGSKRLFAHAVFTPGRPGWLDDLDKAVELKPDSWKGYTVGAPFWTSKWPWRLDDEKVVYPGYEKMVKAGITSVCIHKGLLPTGYRAMMHNTWRYGLPDDVLKAAKDWPQLTFVIYHSAIRHGSPPNKKDVELFEKKGEIPWVSDLARIPAEHGLKNIYAEIGSTFAVTAVSNPRFCAGILGTLLKGFGHERVLWGTDSVWYGSPQWQIEAFRRLEIPEDLRKRLGFEPLGEANGKVKQAILGGNAARLYHLERATSSAFRQDRIAALKRERTATA